MIEEDKLNALELLGENEYLHKEIERLKEKNEELMSLYTSERYVKEDYKSKVNKAIDYINNIKEQWTNKSVPERNLYMFETYLNGITKLVDLKFILEGEDNEN